jgi:hypothetical protein
VLFFAPEMGGHFLEHANFDPANPLQTPEHIAPVWYFTPFYAILRAVPNKLLGVVLMGTAVVAFSSCRGSIGPPLSRFAIAAGCSRLPVRVCGQLRRARLSRPAAGDAGLHQRCARLLGGLLRVLHPDAVVHEGDQTSRCRSG